MISSIYFIPHGMQIIPDLDKSGISDFLQINQNIIRTLEDLKDKPPKYIILFTPHGYNLDKEIVLLNHNKFQGFYYEINPEESVVYGDLKFKLDWNGDQDLVKQFSDYLKENNYPHRNLTLGYPDYPLTIGWGETVPLYYLDKTQRSKIIIIGFPRSRHENLSGLQKQLKNLSRLLFTFFNTLDDDVILALSGDLAHTHNDDGPYGYHKSAEKFDDIYNQWVNKLDVDKFQQLVTLQPTAMACGMAGISIIQYLSNIIKLEYDFNYYNCPTYFGMAISKWKVNF